jgi:hypothetical protein
VQHRYLAGDYAGAVAAAATARPLQWAMPAFPERGEYMLYTALALAAYHGEAPADERPRLLEELATCHAQLEEWAEHCPPNFIARAALAGAELARLRGEAGRASRRYEQAIRAAREHRFVQTEAVAYEAAARFLAMAPPEEPSRGVRKSHEPYDARSALGRSAVDDRGDGARGRVREELGRKRREPTARGSEERGHGARRDRRIRSRRLESHAAGRDAL